MHTTQSNQSKNGCSQIQEITGRPAKLINNGFGNFVLPASGMVTLKISGDLLVVSSKGVFDKHESWTRIQTIDCVELIESPQWEVLVLGIPLLGMALFFLSSAGGKGVGVFLLLMALACIGLFLKYRRRYLGIYSQRNVISVFLTKPPEMYQQFAMNLLAIARRLNTLPRVPAQQQPSSTNGRVPNTGSHTSGRPMQHTSGRSAPANSRPLPATIPPHTTIQ